MLLQYINPPYHLENRHAEHPTLLDPGPVASLPWTNYVNKGISWVFFWFAYYFSRCVESWNYSHISYISIMIFSCFHLFIFDLHSNPHDVLTFRYSYRMNLPDRIPTEPSPEVGLCTLDLSLSRLNSLHPIFIHFSWCASAKVALISLWLGLFLLYLTFPMSLIPRVRPTLDLHYVLFAPPARAAAPCTFNCSHQFGSWKKAWMKHSTLTEISVKWVKKPSKTVPPKQKKPNTITQ